MISQSYWAVDKRPQKSSFLLKSNFIFLVVKFIFNYFKLQYLRAKILIVILFLFGLDISYSLASMLEVF